MIIIEGTLQFLLFRFRFIRCVDENVGSAKPKHLFEDSGAGDFIHFRSFSDNGPQQF
jgi:hypothetical protein